MQFNVTPQKTQTQTKPWKYTDAWEVESCRKQKQNNRGIHKSNEAVTQTEPEEARECWINEGHWGTTWQENEVSGWLGFGCHAGLTPKYRVIATSMWCELTPLPLPAYTDQTTITHVQLSYAEWKQTVWIIARTVPETAREGEDI